MRSAAKTWARIAFDQRHQRRRRRAHPVGERRDVEIDAFPRIDRALTVERQMQAVLGEQHMGEQLRSGTPARDRMRGRRRLADRLAGPAGELLAHMLDHLPLARNELQRLGHVLADLAQCRPAAARAGRGRRIDDPLARQMLGQRTARRPAPFERWHRVLAAAAAICAAVSACAASASISASCSSSCSSSAPVPRIGRTARGAAW